jgi:TonB family protein
MLRHKWTIFACAALLTAHAISGDAQSTPPPANPLPAHVAWTTDPVRRCPDMRIADDGAAAVVVFLVSAAGVPSRASIKSSSGSETFDAAAISCVSKLRFQAATRFGDGVPVESWQAIGWRQVNQPQKLADADATSRPPAPQGAAAAALIGTEVAASAPRPPSSRSVGVRACTDLTGKLAEEPSIIRSSGDAALDEAAVKIAKSGAGYYRPATSGGAAVSGCARLEIQFESK